MVESPSFTADLTQSDEAPLQLYIQQQKLLEIKIKTLNTVTIIAVAVYTLIILGSFFYEKYLSYVTIFVFTCLGIGFFATGILMIFSLKSYFTEFYDKVSCVLWGATMLLAIPMFLRAINWVMQKNYQDYYDLYYGNLAYSNAIYCLLTTIFPVVAQMASLIFGAYRRHKANETKINHSSSDRILSR